MTEEHKQNAGSDASEPLRDAQGREVMQFPCRFPLKTFGRGDHEDFEQVIIDLLRPHCGEDCRFEINRNRSSGGKFQSLTVTFEASSREQLDAIYRALSDCEHVVMSL